MNTEISKILRFFITFAKLSNYVYFPTGGRLSSVTLPEYVRDEELRKLFHTRSVAQFLDTYKIYGAATPFHVLNFLKMYEGKAIIKRILETSSFVNTDYNIDDLLDNVSEELPTLTDRDDPRKYL